MYVKCLIRSVREGRPRVRRTTPRSLQHIFIRFLITLFPMGFGVRSIVPHPAVVEAQHRASLQQHRVLRSRSPPCRRLRVQALPPQALLPGGPRARERRSDSPKRAGPSAPRLSPSRERGSAPRVPIGSVGPSPAGSSPADVRRGQSTPSGNVRRM